MLGTINYVKKQKQTNKNMAGKVMGQREIYFVG